MLFVAAAAHSTASAGKWLAVLSGSDSNARSADLRLLLQTAVFDELTGTQSVPVLATIDRQLGVLFTDHRASLEPPSAELPASCSQMRSAPMPC